jgi:protein XagA
MIHIKRPILFFLALLPLFAHAGGPWTQSVGDGFFKIDYSTINAKYLFNNNRLLVVNTPLRNSTSALFGEYGIANHLTGFAYVPFYVHNTLSKTVNVSNTGFGDVDLGLRYGLLTKGAYPLSISLQVGIPSGDATNVNALYTGDGEFNQYLRLETGTSGNKWWTSGDAGFNNRIKGYSDEIRYNVEFGYKLFNSKLLAILKFGGIKSLNNGNKEAASQGLFSNNVEYLAFAPELNYLPNGKFGLSLRYGGAFSGRNVLGSPALSVGAFYLLKK